MPVDFNLAKKPEPCPECGLRFQCICELTPQLSNEINLILITHPNECYRDTNTGVLLQQSLPNCRSFIWDRKSPEPTLLTLLESKELMPLLLFPSETSIEITNISNHHTSPKIPLFIILDSTWQEAGKMIRRSHWLKDIQTVHLNVVKESKYTLRRNQNTGHLCTCEVGVELLNTLGDKQGATELSHYFEHYVKVFKADKSGHRFIPK